MSLVNEVITEAANLIGEKKYARAKSLLLAAASMLDTDSLTKSTRPARQVATKSAAKPRGYNMANRGKKLDSRATRVPRRPLSETDKSSILAMNAAGEKPRVIAAALNRHPSHILKFLNKYGPKAGETTTPQTSSPSSPSGL